MTMFKKCRGIHKEKRLGSKMARASREWQGRGGSGYRAGSGEQRPTWKPGAGVGKRYGSCRGETGWQRSDYCVIRGFFLSLSLCRRGFQDLLKVRPSSLFMLCGCISSSVASLMIRSMYPVLAERGFVPCSLVMWSWLMLCSTTADLSRCASVICLMCSLIRVWMDRPLFPI